MPCDVGHLCTEAYNLCVYVPTRLRNSETRRELLEGTHADIYILNQSFCPLFSAGRWTYKPVLDTEYCNVTVCMDEMICNKIHYSVRHTSERRGRNMERKKMLFEITKRRVFFQRTTCLWHRLEVTVREFEYLWRDRIIE